MSNHEEQSFTQAEAQNHPDYTLQEQKALALLKELLAALTAKDYRERINEMFFSFLATEAADYQPTREKMVTVHYELSSFFTKIRKLQLIDRHRLEV